MGLQHWAPGPKRAQLCFELKPMCACLQTCMQIMFETFNVPAMYVAIQVGKAAGDGAQLSLPAKALQDLGGETALVLLLPGVFA